jgi:outer membrane protein TolC
VRVAPALLALALLPAPASAATETPADAEPASGGRAPSEADGAPRRMTLADAIATALRTGLQVKAANQAVAAAELRVKAAGAQRLPALQAAANLQYWDRPLDVSFGPPPTAGTPASPAVRIRDQLTWQASVTLVQPLTGLIALSRLIDLEENGTGAARADSAQARLDAAQGAAATYLRVLQGRALEAIAAKSLEQVEAQLKRAQILERGGVMGHVDVLRLTATRAVASQALMRARGATTVAVASLVLALNLQPGTAIEVVDDLPDPPPPFVLREPEAVQIASSDRPEIDAARERVEQAVANRGVALARMLPNVNAVSTYQHTEGQAAFQPKDAWFIGGVLSWDVWDWGRNWRGVREAEARAGQAAFNAEALRKQVAVEAQRTLVDLRTADEALQPARAELEAAEEAYRIQSVRYAQGAATTTDLIASEVEVLRARSGYAQARTDVYLSQVALARALGRMPLTIGSSPAAPASGGESKQ